MTDKPASSLGAALFGWTQNPRAGAAFAIGLTLIAIGMVALEVLLPRASQGLSLDERVGFYAGAGLAAGLGLVVAAALIGRTAEALGGGDDDDQP